jgi:hypothetical protein
MTHSCRRCGRGTRVIVAQGRAAVRVAEEEAHVLLFEPASTLNTGNVQNERTVAQLDRIYPPWSSILP